MKKIIICIATAISLVISAITPVCAETIINNHGQPRNDTSAISEEWSEVVEDVTGINDVQKIDEEPGKDYYSLKNNDEIEIPKNGSDNIVLGDLSGEDIGIGLPKELSGVTGEISDNGTIVYSDEGDESVAVQATSELQGNLVVEGVRSMIIIENAEAEKEYQFHYDLPDGYALLKSEKYPGSTEKGWIYIIDKNNKNVDGNELTPEICGVIEPAWAVDANGKQIKTEYAIKGSVLIQKIVFDDSSAFPIVADPKTTKKPKPKRLGSYSTKATINHYVVGATSYGYTSKSFVLKKKVREKIEDAIAKKIGSKFIPGLNWASYVVDGYCLIQGCRGYSKTVINITYEKWTYYKHQGGNWVSGYQFKVKKLKFTLKK